MEGGEWRRWMDTLILLGTFHPGSDCDQFALDHVKFVNELCDLVQFSTVLRLLQLTENTFPVIRHKIVGVSFI